MEPSDVPAPGDEVYVGSSLHLTHGRDDFRGGLCRVVSVRERHGLVFVEVAEDPGTLHAWPYLAEHQDEWRARFGQQHGRPDPDLRPEFNEE